MIIYDLLAFFMLHIMNYLVNGYCLLCFWLPGSGKAFTDDSRLSVLMRRVLRADDDRERRLSFVKQLHEFFLLPENYGVCSSLFHLSLIHITVIVTFL